MQAGQVMGSWVGGGTDRWLDGHEDGQSCGWRGTDGWVTDRWVMDRWMGDGQMGG